MKREQKFEEIIRDKFEGFQADAPSWDSFEKALDKSKSKAFGYKNGIIISCISIAIVGLGFVYLSKTNPDINSTSNLSIANNSVDVNKTGENKSEIISESEVSNFDVVSVNETSENEVEILSQVSKEKNQLNTDDNIILNEESEVNSELIEELNEGISKMPEIKSVKDDRIEDFNIAISNSRICLGEDVQIQADRINLHTDYVIDFGDGVKSESFSAMHSYTKSGEYSVRIIASIDGKEIVREKTVSVIKSPKLDIGDFELDKSKIVNKVSFNANSSVDNYQWYINGELMTSDKSFDHTFDRQGKYVVKCVSSVSQCETVAKKVIEVEGYYNIKQFMPTAFTPDNDGRNDFYDFSVLKNINANDISMKIFDRKGQVLFESNNVNDKWNGINQTDGKLAPSQNGYFWIIELTNEKGMKEVYKNTFVLVR